MLNLNDRQQRWITAVLVLGTLVLGRVAISVAATILFGFGDVILVFFLAWLLAFSLSPFVNALTRLVPVLPRVGALVLVYVALAAVMRLLVVCIARCLSPTISGFI